MRPCLNPTAPALLFLVALCQCGSTESPAGPGLGDAAGSDGGAEDAPLADAAADVGDDGGAPDGGGSSIGSAGGTVTGPDGAQVIVPAGALATTVEISITRPATTSPSFPPAGTLAAGATYEIKPHGLQFASPVTLRVPFDTARVPAGAELQLYRAQPGGAFAALTGATIAGSFISAPVDGFSYVAPGYPSPLAFSEISRSCVRESLGGDVWCWGDLGTLALNTGLAEPQLKTTFREPTRLPPRALTSIAAGSDWVCGVDVLNVWCIGNAALTRTAPPPGVPDPHVWVKKALPPGVVLTDLVGGGSFACGLGAANSPDSSAVGKVFCFGDNTMGQLGRDRASNAWEVLPINSMQRYGAILAAGTFACAARLPTGDVDCWGSNVYGGVSASSLGSLDSTDVPIPRGLVVDPRRGGLRGGGLQACGLQGDGTVFCWGDNSNGQMGDGTATTVSHRAPSEVPGIKFKSIWPGDTMAGIGLDDVVYSWGHATEGSLGNGSDTAGGPPADADKQKTPVRVAVPLGVSFEQMSNLSLPGKCARTTRNEVFCWGSNRSFNLGTSASSPASSNLPVRIKSASLLRQMP